MIVKQLSAAVGYLPIALDLAAARVARGKSWSELNSALTAEIARLEELEGVRRRSKKETRLEASFNLSINNLREDFPETWESFVWLGVLPEDVNIAAPMVATLWDVDLAEAAERLELFWNDALLLPGVSTEIDEKEWKTYRLHDLLHDLARKWLTTEKNPGLGLTIPQAHGALLERYQNQLNTEKWHELADDGYIHEHLSWHMEKAGCIDSIHQLLREETESGKNGWYSACDRLGKTAIFVADVARAWKLAEKDYEINPGKTVGLQIRYLLIISSLNDIASKIYPDIATTLVERKLWTPSQGLAYAYQIQSLPNRLQVLIGNETHLVTLLIAIASNSSKPEIWSKVLRLAHNVRGGSEIEYMIRLIVPNLPDHFIPTVLEIALAIENEAYRASSLCHIVPRLSDELLLKVLEVARKIEHKFCRAKLLGVLAPRLPYIWQETLQSILDIEKEDSRSNLFDVIAPNLPKNLLPQVLEMAFSIEGEDYRANAVGDIIKYHPNLLTEIFKNINSSSRFHTFTLSKIAKYYSTQSPLLALEIALQIQPIANQVDVLCEIAPHLPQEALPQVIEIAFAFNNDRYLAAIVNSIGSRLPKNLLPTVVDTTLGFEDKSNWTDVLSAIAKDLSKNVLYQFVDDAAVINDREVKSKILCTIAPYLPEIWTETLDNILNIENSYERLTLLASVVQYLPNNLLPQVLELARTAENLERKAELFSELAPHLPEIWDEALEAIFENHRTRRYLNHLIHKTSAVHSPLPFTLWSKTIDFLKYLNREETLDSIKKNIQLIKDLGDLDSLEEIADAAIDIRRWFP